VTDTERSEAGKGRNEGEREGSAPAGAADSPRQGNDWAALYGNQDTAARYDRRFRGRVRGWNNRRVRAAVFAALQRMGGGRLPERVIDAPAGTGRFTADFAAAGVRVIHLDRSAAMLACVRATHGPGMEVRADLRHPPLDDPGAVVLCLRLMQHLGPEERVEALAGLRRMAPRAVVAYYPGRHYKDVLRRWRRRLGLPFRTLRPRLGLTQMRAEAERAGWRLVEARAVLPLLSENHLLLLEHAP